jgi:2-keto-4-pentenoate hydratase/2-oxohepta-3-ene-1,7-dioic acid hydratase in catechol pathway
MKLLRVGNSGQERPCVIGSDGVIRDASSICEDFGPMNLAPEFLQELSSRIGSLPAIATEGQRTGAPMTRPGKIICIGLNYRNHAKEAGMEIPSEPIIFMKAPNTVIGPNDDVRIPRRSQKTDWEVELCVVIGSRASYIESETDAMSYVAGFAISNDVSEREFQLERGGQWDKGKSCDTFNPLGPFIVTRDEVSDVQNLDMWLDVDGVRQQSGSTSDMIFSVAHIVWYVSQFMVLEPGDLINTGTPAGVGSGYKPPRFLRPGQEIALGIDGLGQQRVRTIATP